MKSRDVFEFQNRLSEKKDEIRQLERQLRIERGKFIQKTPKHGMNTESNIIFEVAAFFPV